MWGTWIVSKIVFYRCCCIKKHCILRALIGTQTETRHFHVIYKAPNPYSGWVGELNSSLFCK